MRIAKPGLAGKSSGARLAGAIASIVLGASEQGVDFTSRLDDRFPHLETDIARDRLFLAAEVLESRAQLGDALGQRTRAPPSLR
jgi:hypothetical protein